MTNTQERNQGNNLLQNSLENKTLWSKPNQEGHINANFNTLKKEIRKDSW